MALLAKFALVLTGATAGIAMLANAYGADDQKAEPVRYVGNDKPAVADEMAPIEFVYAPEEMEQAVARVNTGQRTGGSNCETATDQLPQTPASFLGGVDAKPAAETKLIHVPVI